MSLDVYLNMKNITVPPKGERIYIRENGENHDISREEWDMRYPGKAPITVEDISGSDEVYSANITHNLTRMADQAGVYEHLWRPDEIGISKARQLIEPLRAGLELLRSDRARFETFNPSNGWGDYDGLVRFIDNYLAACEQYPDADVSVWR